MSNKNYTNYSKMSSADDDSKAPVDNPIVEVTPAVAVVEPTNAVEPVTPVTPVDPEPEVTPPAPEPPVKGKVVGCERLRVRKLPDKNAEVLGTIEADSKVQIDLSKSTTNWYAVYTAAGLAGYCMKKYISTK